MGGLKLSPSRAALKRTAESAEFRCSPPQLTLSGPKIQSKMTDGHPSEFFKWWIVDESTGKRSLSTYLKTRADAARAFPGAEPDVRTREIRDLPSAGQLPAASRPGTKWS